VVARIGLDVSISSISWVNDMKNGLHSFDNSNNIAIYTWNANFGHNQLVSREKRPCFFEFNICVCSKTYDAD
jgi:hypothetical protein